MTIITDYADPCAVLPRIREAYYALLEGRRPEVIEFDAGNGVRRKVQYGKTDLASLRAELSRLESFCGRTGGLRKRFGLRAGGYVMPGQLLRLSDRLLNTPLLIHPAKAQIILGALERSHRARCRLLFERRWATGHGRCQSFRRFVAPRRRYHLHVAFGRWRGA